MESPSYKIKNQGQILIEGVFLLIVFFGFLFSLVHLENTLKEHIHKERLKPSERKSTIPSFRKDR